MYSLKIYAIGEKSELKLVCHDCNKEISIDHPANNHLNCIHYDGEDEPFLKANIKTSSNIIHM